MPTTGPSIDQILRARDVLDANTVLNEAGRLDGPAVEALMGDLWGASLVARLAPPAPPASAALMRGVGRRARGGQIRVATNRSESPAPRRVSVKYDTRYAIGDVVRFDPEGDRAGEGIGATVTAVTFTESKVLYDLRLATRHGLDMQRVDSTYVWDAEEV